MKKLRNKVHSTIAIYVMVVNNPKTIRFLPSKMHLSYVLSGLQEPTVEQLNKLISVLIDEFIQLYNGEQELITVPIGVKCSSSSQAYKSTYLERL